ncbi:MAG: lipocalin-like domain-containing protein [Pseudomonadota bacterium]
MSDDRLIGIWSLVSYILTLAEEQRVEPIGPTPIGRLIYTDMGLMSAHLMAAGPGQVSYLSYSGKWRRVGSEVLHDVDISSRVGMVGTTVRRNLALTDGQLTLTARNAPWQNQHGTGRLTWRRAD